MSEVALNQLGRYRILGELGRGAMGVVYKAEDPMLDRVVAIKTITMSGDTAQREEYEARFYQEAKAAGGLNHPNVITIHDIGREGDIAYMAMELLEGIDLREMMKRGRMPLARALDIAAQVADGLAFAHERGVVHRDVKPANIMIVHDRHAKIMDFGIARMRLSDIQTQAGAILGSPKYMSPEQVSGMRADQRSDLFSLGIVIYELTSGAAPFTGPNVTELMHRIATATQLPPSSIDTSLPAMLDLIVAKALRKDPGARYQSADELAADLRACMIELRGEQVGADDTTVVVPVDAEASTIPLGQATTEPNVTQDATPERSRAADIAIDSGAPVYLSRRFDSSEAMERLARLAASHGAGTASLPPSTGVRKAFFGARAAMPFERVRQDTDLRNAALAIIIAAVIALIIAFL